MSSILHRTTFEYKPIAHTPDYATVDYVINPDLSPIGDVRPSLKLHKLTGDVLSNLSAAEQDALVTLDEYKAAAQLEVDAQTTKLVAAGFEFSGDSFPFSIPSSATVIAVDGVTAVELADGAAVTAFESIRAARVAKIFTQTTVPKGGDVLKSDISKAADKAAVDLVEDTRT